MVKYIAGTSHHLLGPLAIIVSRPDIRRTAVQVRGYCILTCQSGYRGLELEHSGVPEGGIYSEQDHGDHL